MQKKNLLKLMILLLASFIVLLTPVAAQPFTDVPPEHWSRQAIDQLAAAGIITDWPGAGNQLLDRYQLAEVVARAIEQAANANEQQRGIIAALSSEYAAELKALNGEISQIAAGYTEHVYITGVVTGRYDNYNQVIDGEQQPKANGSKLLRSELSINGVINDHWNYYSLLRNDKILGNPSVSQDSNANNNWEFRQAYVQGGMAGVNIAIGRQTTQPAYGLVISDDFTGLHLDNGSQNLQISLDWGNYDNIPCVDPTGSEQGVAQDGVNWLALSLGSNLGDSTNIKLAYMQAQSQGGAEYWQGNYGQLLMDDRRSFVELGFAGKLSREWLVTAVAARSNAATQNNAYSLQLDYKAIDINKPGTYHYWLAYRNIQAVATLDSVYNDIPGYNNSANVPAGQWLGARGWEVGWEKVWAKNIASEVFCNIFRPTDGNYVNTFCGNLEANLYWYF